MMIHRYSLTPAGLTGMGLAMLIEYLLKEGPHLLDPDPPCAKDEPTSPQQAVHTLKPGIFIGSI